MDQIKFSWGSLKQIALAAGISRGFLNNILRGRKKCKASTAAMLAEAALDHGYSTSPFDWMNPLGTKNPLFAPYQRKIADDMLS